MPTYTELMEILKANEIRGYSHFIKSKLIDLLIKRRLIPEKYDTNNKQVKVFITYPFNFSNMVLNTVLNTVLNMVLNMSSSRFRCRISIK